MVAILQKYSKFASVADKRDLRENTPALVDPRTRLSAKVQGAEPQDGEQGDE